ncbi:MAG: DHH family phosphoesterase [Verrucomicrobia bacterium]|nr:DHH family phosphoesterase [Verrucomicrobiota bacterium]
MNQPADTPPTAVTHADRLLEFLEQRRNTLAPLLILMHDYPDPDALAAGFALQHLVQTMVGVESRLFYGGAVGRTENREMVRLLKIRIHKVKRGVFKKEARVALVDTQPGFGNNAFPRKRRATLVIDQHASAAPPEADLVIIDPHCGATCVIVAQALLRQAAPIPPRVATALAYGILTDTLDLYRATRPDVLQTYLAVLQHCDMRLLARIQNPQRPQNFFATLGKGIRNATVSRRLLVSHLGAVSTPDLVSQVAEFLLAYRQLHWCLVTGRCQGRLHASLRTNRPDAQAGEVLREVFGERRLAGGHGAIAGGSCLVGLEAPDEAWAEREQTLTARLMKRLRISSEIEPRKPFAR